MSDERFVYLVSEGIYSDYRVVGVYENPAAAAEHAGRLHDEPRVERYLLNGASSGLDVWFVILNGDGSVFNVGNEWTSEYSPEESAGLVYGKSPGPYRYKVNVLARNEEHAVKIAMEKLMQVKASGFWDGSSKPAGNQLPVDEGWWKTDED